MNANHQPPQPEVQVQVTKQRTLTGVTLAVQRADDGGRVLQIIDPIAGQLTLVPLTPAIAREIGNQLVSAVPIVGANEMPKP